MTASLHHIAILCSDKVRSLAFYEALGFCVQQHYPRPERQDEIWMLSGHGIILELFVKSGCPERPTGPEAYGLRHLALRVTQLEKWVQVLHVAGYAPEPIRQDSFDGQKMTFVKDPDGLPIELHE